MHYAVLYIDSRKYEYVCYMLRFYIYSTQRNFTHMCTLKLTDKHNDIHKATEHNNQFSEM